MIIYTYTYIHAYMHTHMCMHATVASSCRRLCALEDCVYYDKGSLDSETAQSYQQISLNKHSSTWVLMLL